MRDRVKSKITMLFLITVILAAAASLQPVAAQDNSPTNPAAAGSPVRSMVELGAVNANIYDIMITVIETVRGKEAMDRLKAANPKAKMPAEGFEYVLARAKFDFKGRSVSDTLSFNLGDEPLQWVALSGADLGKYDGASVSVPKPALAGRLKPGNSLEGWLVFEVKQKDTKPVMVFDPDAGGATGRGKTLFFKLY